MIGISQVPFFEVFLFKKSEKPSNTDTWLTNNCTMEEKIPDSNVCKPANDTTYQNTVKKEPIPENVDGFEYSLLTYITLILGMVIVIGLLISIIISKHSRLKAEQKISKKNKIKYEKLKQEFQKIEINKNYFSEISRKIRETLEIEVKSEDVRSLTESVIGDYFRDLSIEKSSG